MEACDRIEIWGGFGGGRGLQSYIGVHMGVVT